MCGRFAINDDMNELLEAFVAEHGIQALADWPATLSIAPTDEIPIVRDRVLDDGLRREIALARWGLRTSWMRGPSRPLINARLETAAEKPTFRKAFAERRCVVPMSGYFEWLEEDGGKQPYWVHGDGLLAAAAIAEPVRREDGEWELTAAILTCEAVDGAGEVHERMPVFLTADAREAWLAPGRLDDPAAMTGLLGASAIEIAAGITSHAVDRRINRAADRTLRHDPSVLDPIR
ncbi:MAG: SOS response-associated peptidase [Microbacteriaceae bacterium]